MQSANKIQANNPPEERTVFVFFLFCIWTFVLLCRPQDLFPVLGQIRPALTMGALTLGFVILRLKDLPGPPLFQERQIKYFSLLLLIMIIGIPFAHHKGMAFEAVFERYLTVIIFFFLFYKLVSSVARLYKVLLIACLGNGLYSAFALINYQTGRLSFGGMFDPNDLAFFSLAFFPLNLIFIARDNPFWVRLACLSCFGTGVLLILLTGSRGGMIAFIVVAAMLLLLKTQTIKLFLKAVFVVMCVVFVSFSPIDTERYKTILALEDDYNIEGHGGRIDLWKFGLKAMLENPLTGVGVNGYSRALGYDRMEREAETLRWQAPHNSVVQIGAETGIFGLALFLLLSGNVVRILNSAKKKASQQRLVKIGEMGMIGFAGLFISGFFLSHGYSFYFAFYFAISAVVSQLLVKEQNPAPNQA